MEQMRMHNIFFGQTMWTVDGRSCSPQTKEILHVTPQTSASHGNACEVSCLDNISNRTSTSSSVN